MKKYLLFFLTFFIFPIIVSASNYKIEQYYIKSDVDIMGNLNVHEIIVMNGTFNGFERIIDYTNDKLSNDINFEKSAIYNASDIVNVKVKAKKISNQIDFNTFSEDFTTFEKVNSANLGDKLVYTENKTSNSTSIKMYYNANNERIAFYVSYVILDVNVMHNDVNEVYWQYFSESFRDNIEELKIRLFLPYEDNSDNFRFWAHGNLSGEITDLFDENKNHIGVQATINNLKASSPVDIRMTFDRSLLNEQFVSKKTNQDALKSILEVEKNRAEEANKQRSIAKYKYYLSFYGSIVYMIFLIAVWIYIYLKYDREHKSSFKNKYYREFIEDYPVEVIDYLINKKITPNAMSASIMNLIYKKNISVEEIAIKKNKKAYEFTLQNNKNITDNEKYLIDFLFNEIGANNKFTNKELEAYAKGTKTYSKFTTSYNTWKNKTEVLGERQNFFENNNLIKIIGFIFALLGGIIFYIAISSNISNIPVNIILFPASLFLIYVLSFTKRTKKGNEDYLKWKAFKKFLLDFSILPERELPEVAIWERYMVYAVILGVAEKVSKAMNVRINEVSPNNDYMSLPMSNIYWNMQLHNIIYNSVNTAVRESINASMANSKSSSGSGFGGGFSSGGGFGGGGGGGGGF